MWNVSSETEEIGIISAAYELDLVVDAYVRNYWRVSK